MDRVLVIPVGGDVDGAAILAASRAASAHLSARGTAVVLDFSGAYFLDEEAAAGLLHFRRAHAGPDAPRMALAGLSPFVRGKLRRLGILDLFAVYEDPDAARAALDPA